MGEVKMKSCKAVAWILCAVEILTRFLCQAQQVSKGPCTTLKLKHCFCDFNNDNDVIAVNCTNTELVGNKLQLDIEVTVRKLTFTGNYVEKLNSDFIKQCSDDGIVALPNLHILDLSRNNITTIDPTLFKCTPNLKKILLNKNNLYFNNATSPMLHNLNNVKELHLQAAFYEKANGHYDKDKGRIVSVLHYTEIQWVFNEVSLPNLVRLHLEHNNLWYINSSALCQPLPLLENLYLSHNHIRPSNMDITCLSHLKVLFMDNNAVVYLPEPFINQMGKSHLTQLNLTDNPWQCDCNFHKTLEWLQSDESHFVNKSSLWCYVERKMKYIVDLEESDLTCEYITPLDKRLKNSYIVLGCVFAAIGIMFLVVLYLNREKIIRFGKRCFDPFLNYNPSGPRGTYSSVAV